MFSAFNKEKMVAPIHASRLRVGGTANHPMLLPRDYVRAMEKAGKLQFVLPHQHLQQCKDTLTEFWRRWKNLYADHEVFSKVPASELCLSVPCRLHGDEGRSALPLYTVWCAAL